MLLKSLSLRDPGLWLLLLPPRQSLECWQKSSLGVRRATPTRPKKGPAGQSACTSEAPWDVLYHLWYRPPLWSGIRSRRNKSDTVVVRGTAWPVCLYPSNGSSVCFSTSHSSLIQWFETAPSRTCPQCRIQVRAMGRKHLSWRYLFLARERESGKTSETEQYLWPFWTLHGLRLIKPYLCFWVAQEACLCPRVAGRWTCCPAGLHLGKFGLLPCLSPSSMPST